MPVKHTHRSGGFSSSSHGSSSTKAEPSTKAHKTKGSSTSQAPEPRSPGAARNARSHAAAQARQGAEDRVFQLRDRMQQQPARATYHALSASEPRGSKWDNNVEGWQRYCAPFQKNASAAISSKVKALDFAQQSVKDTVQYALKHGTASGVNAGHWSTVPGREDVPIFFRDFNGPKGEKVQLYSYPRVSTPLPSDPATREQTLKNAQWASFDVSGKLAQAYGDEHFLHGNTGTASVLGLPVSGAEGLNPSRDWPDGMLAKDPEIAGAIAARQPVRFQNFENGILVEKGGQVQAFSLDGKRLGTAWPAGTIDGVADSRPPSGAGAGFVGVENGHFVVDGQPFRHVGANMSQLMYENKDRIWDELSRLKDAGVKDVRILLPNSALTKEQVGDKLEQLLNLADAQGMKVTVSLTQFARQEFYTDTDPSNMGGHNNLWNSGDYGGPFELVKGDEKYAEWTYVKDAQGNIQKDENGNPRVNVGHPVLNNQWLKDGYKENYKPFVEYIVDRFKGNKAVMAWEVANETKSYFDPPAYKETKDFYSDMVATIRAKDPNHLVSAGLTNSREFVGTDPAERKKFLAQFDFVSVHQYNGDFMDDIKSDIDTARQLGKPAVLGEFGFYAGGSRTSLPSMDEVRAYVNRAYNELGVDAVMPWAAGAVGGERWWDNEYGPNGLDQFHSILRDANTAMEDWNARN